MTTVCKQLHSAVIFLLLGALAAAGAWAESGQDHSGKKVDFSGFWEMDYAASDNIQARLNSLVRELQQLAQRRSNGTMDNRPGGGTTMGSGSYNSGPSVIGLAQMADMITQSQLLEVVQDEHEVRIKREDTFALSCELYDDYAHSVETLFGREVCGWDSHQLLFKIYLPEGLSIQHRFTLGSSGERLNIATTVVSDRVSYPFTLNRVYTRYDPEKTGISCEMTLTRGKVCTTYGYVPTVRFNHTAPRESTKVLRSEMPRCWRGPVS